MADKDLRRRTTPVFPRTRSSTNDATSRSDYDLEHRSLSAAGTDPLAELERLVGEIDSFVKTRAGADRGSEVNNNDYSSQSDAVEKDVDAQIYDEVDSAGRQQHEAEYYDDERGITDRQYDGEADHDGSQSDTYSHHANQAPGLGRTRRKTLITVGAVLGLLLICAIGAYAYRVIFGSAPGVPPIVNTDASPTKIAVASSDNRDDSLVPREEQPVDTTFSTPSAQHRSSPAASVAPEPSRVQSPTEPHPAYTVAAPPSTAPDEPAAAAAALAPTAATADPRPASPRPAAPKANQKIASQGEAPEISQVGQSPVGRYMIQISASAAREEATAALKAAQAKYPDVLGGQQSQVREKKLADKTPLFTAQFGPFTSRAEAAELCQRLKSAGGSCYVP